MIWNNSPYDKDIFMHLIEGKLEDNFHVSAIVITEPIEGEWHVEAQGYVWMQNGIQSRSYNEIFSDETIKRVLYEKRGPITGKKTGII